MCWGWGWDVAGGSGDRWDREVHDVLLSPCRPMDIREMTLMRVMSEETRLPRIMMVLFLVFLMACGKNFA